MGLSARCRFRLCLGLLWLLPAALPLRAQLDPRLQSSVTDFLDLYQQSSSVQAKPEILTLFDFSRSMASLMFHPQYQNADITDGDDYRYMGFTVTPSGGGTASNNTYTITASDATCTSAQSSVKFVVAADNSVTTTYTTAGSASCTTNSTASSYTIKAAANGASTASASVSASPVSATTNGTAYNLTIGASTGTIAGTGGWASYTIASLSVIIGGTTYTSGTITNIAPGTVVTFKTTLSHSMGESEPSGDDVINWSTATGGALTGASPTFSSSATWTVPNFVTTAANPTWLKPITITGTIAGGNAITLNTYYHTIGFSTTIKWAESGSNNCTAVHPIVAIAPTSTTASTVSGGSVTWTIPPYCGTNSGTTLATITGYLDPRAGLSPVPGANYLANTLTFVGLVKPNGSLVTASDAAGPYSSGAPWTPVGSASTLNGTGNGANDARNWLRAASHVRFSYAFAKNGLPFGLCKAFTRTVDIPLPWKIVDPAATIANPLASQRVTDSVTTKGVPYGSGNSMEMDGCYGIEGGAGAMFYTANNINFNAATTYAPATTATAATVIIYDIVYRPAYISWLFNGQYQNSSSGKPYYTTDTINLALPGTSTTLPGNLIVYDAVTVGVAAGQTGAGTLAWGQAFGPSGTAWGNVYVPQYTTAGTLNGGTGLTVPTYTSELTLDASSNQLPPLTRLQAVKKAAIQTWIASQGSVYWAFRFLDVNNEASNGTASHIDNNTATTWSNASYQGETPAYGTWTYPVLQGDDSAWVVLNNTSAQGNTSASGNSVTGMERIANLFAFGSTPLTYAMARSLAQFTDPSSVFNSIEGSAVSQCANSFLILFTDGIDNNGLASDNMTNPNTYTPYVVGTGSSAVFNALAGNQTLVSNPSWVDPPTPFGTTATTNNCWNLYTFAGAAAHMGDSSFGMPNVNYLPGQFPPPAHTSQNPSAYLPYTITQRNGVSYSSPHLITTMTVGVSLGGFYNESGSPKQSLFLAAMVGDPNTKGGTTSVISGFHQFVPPTYNGDGTINQQNDWVPNALDPTSYPKFGTKATGAVYYFDGTNPAALSQGLGLAVALALGTTSNNATSNPNLPYVGATYGQEAYIGKFQPPETGGVIWPGDLLMFGTQDTNGTFSILDKAGNVTSLLNQATAQWSTATALLNNRTWSARKLLTRLPGNATNAELGFHNFSDTGTVYSNAAAVDNTAGLKNYVAIDYLAVGSAAQQAVIQNAAGGNMSGAVDGSGRPTTNRLNIMGDIVDSNPASLQYNFSDSTITTGIGSHGALSLSGANTFRLILVGTNQGWLHAFGETSTMQTVTNSAGTVEQIVKANVDELWAFMPTDFLKNLDYVYGASSSSNPHRFMVDGAPSIYFLDLPPTGGAANGVLDYGNTSTSERAIAIIGLGKGGRSYYAIDIRDPFNPVLLWSLVPDEAAFFPTTRNKSSLTLANLQTLIGTMGFSTCAPGLGRVLFTSGGVQTVKDVVFLGGGLSVPQIEYNFPIYPPPGGQQTFLGRSVIALDVQTGNVLSAYALPNPGNSSATGPGPVVAGVVPTEAILNSGMAQRAYFLDRNGGLWAWGSKQVVDSSSSLYPSYANFRIDTSDLAAWTTDGLVGSPAGVRKVAQDGTGNAAIYTSLPAPFVVGSFPGANKTAGLPGPSAMGVAMNSGDRYNPMDGTYFNGTPGNFRLSVVFDRQDSRAWGFDSQNGPDTGIADTNLKDFTANTFTSASAFSCTDSIGQYITRGCSSYYLNPGSTGTTYFGYYVNFPSLAGGFLPKALTSPEVVSNSIFYTYFTPASYDPCTGGSGNSYSKLMCDVLNPIVQDNRTNVSCLSGTAGIWSGVASGYIAFGTRGVIQSGTVPAADSTPGTPTTTPLMSTFLGQSRTQYPKARVWRTVQ